MKTDWTVGRVLSDSLPEGRYFFRVRPAIPPPFPPPPSESGEKWDTMGLPSKLVFLPVSTLELRRCGSGSKSGTSCRPARDSAR
jgi:hypothetical protein